MKKNSIPLKIYRYRSATQYNLVATLNDAINGSLFGEFNDGTELNFDISGKIIKKYSITAEEKKKIISLLVNNIRDKYYLSCFTTNPPYNKEMWIKTNNKDRNIPCTIREMFTRTLVPLYGLLITLSTFLFVNSYFNFINILAVENPISAI